MTKMKGQVTKMTQQLRQTRKRKANADALCSQLAGAVSVKKEKIEAAESKLEEVETKLQCCDCFELPVTHLLLPCFHLVLCQQCTNGMTECPMCRSPIQQVKKVHLP